MSLVCIPCITRNQETLTTMATDKPLTHIEELRNITKTSRQPTAYATYVELLNGKLKQSASLGGCRAAVRWRLGTNSTAAIEIFESNGFTYIPTKCKDHSGKDDSGMDWNCDVCTTGVMSWNETT